MGGVERPMGSVIITANLSGRGVTTASFTTVVGPMIGVAGKATLGDVPGG